MGQKGRVTLWFGQSICLVGLLSFSYVLITLTTSPPPKRHVMLCFMRRHPCLPPLPFPLPPQTYEAATFSPLCLCDYCPRAYHLACLAPPTPPLSSTTLGEAKMEEPKIEEPTAASAAAATAGPDSAPPAAAAAVGATQGIDDAVMEDSAGGPRQGEVAAEAMKVEGGAEAEVDPAAAAAVAGPGLQGEEPTPDAEAEVEETSAVAVVVLPQFSYAALEGAAWACPHCQERHRRVLEG